MGRWEYFAVLAGCLIVTSPLELVLGAHVYRRPVRLVRTLVLPLLVFYVWDAIAIHRHVWDFASRFTTGWHVPPGVPLEEMAFFVIVPLCALLTFEAVDRLAGRRRG